MFIKKNDKVKVIAGKDKGKEGTVEKVFPSKERVIVKGVNIVKKHKNQLTQIQMVELLKLKHRFMFLTLCLSILQTMNQHGLASRLKMARKYVFLKRQVKHCNKGRRILSSWKIA